MASNKKMDRAVNGPGLFEITLGVILSVALGGLLAALHLVFKPVEVVAKPADMIESGRVYVVDGAVNSSKARQWTRKRQVLAEGNAAEVTFTEEELNAWVASATPARQKAEPEALFAPERVNFRIADGVMQVALLGKFSLFGISHEMVFHTRGKFIEGTAGFAFTADELYLGSLPTHLVPKLKPFLVERIVAAQELPEDLKATWAKLKLVAVEGDTLRLVLP
jgi:hypothetical protein